VSCAVAPPGLQLLLLLLLLLLSILDRILDSQFSAQLHSLRLIKSHSYRSGTLSVMYTNASIYVMTSSFLIRMNNRQVKCQRNITRTK